MVSYTYHGPAIWPFEPERYSTFNSTSTGGTAQDRVSTWDALGIIDGPAISSIGQTAGVFLISNVSGGLHITGGTSASTYLTLHASPEDGGNITEITTLLQGTGSVDVSSFVTSSSVDGLGSTHGLVVLLHTQSSGAFFHTGLTRNNDFGVTSASGAGDTTTSASASANIVDWVIKDENTTRSSVIVVSYLNALTSNSDESTISHSSITLTYLAYTTTTTTAWETVPSTDASSNPINTSRSYTSTIISATGTGTYSRLIATGVNVTPDAVFPYLVTTVFVMETGDYDAIANHNPNQRLIPFERGFSRTTASTHTILSGGLVSITVIPTAFTTRVNQHGFDLAHSGGTGTDAGSTAAQTNLFTQLWTTMTGNAWSVPTQQTCTYTFTGQSAPGESTSQFTSTVLAAASQIWTTLMCNPKDNWLARGDTSGGGSSGMSSFLTSFLGVPFYGTAHTAISDQLGGSSAATFTWWGTYLTSTSSISTTVKDGVRGVVTTGWIYPMVLGDSVTYENSTGTVMTSDSTVSPLELQVTALTTTALVPLNVTTTLLTVYPLGAFQQGVSATGAPSITGSAAAHSGEGGTTVVASGATNSYFVYYSYAVAPYIDSEGTGDPANSSWQRDWYGENHIGASSPGRGYRPLVSTSDTRRFGWMSLHYITSVAAWSTGTAGTTTSTACNFNNFARFNTYSPQFSFYDGNGVTTSWNLNEGTDGGDGTWYTATYDTVNKVPFVSQADNVRPLWMIETPAGFWLPFSFLTVTTTELGITTTGTGNFASTSVATTADASYTDGVITALLLNINATSAIFHLTAGGAQYKATLSLGAVQSSTGEGAYWTFLHQNNDNSRWQWLEARGLSANPPWRMGWPQTQETVSDVPISGADVGGVFGERTFPWTVAPLTTICDVGVTLLTPQNQGFVKIDSADNTATTTFSRGQSINVTDRSVFTPASVYRQNVRYIQQGDGQISATARVWNDSPDSEQPSYINPIT